MYGKDPMGGAGGPGGPQGHPGWQYKSTMDVNELFRKAFGFNMV